MILSRKIFFEKKMKQSSKKQFTEFIPLGPILVVLFAYMGFDKVNTIWLLLLLLLTFMKKVSK